MRGGFYQWLAKPLSDCAIEDQRLPGLIRASHTTSGGVYGAPRIFLDLREAGKRCGHNRVARIMRENKIKALGGYKAPCHIAARPSIIAPNRLQREFTVEHPDPTSPISVPGGGGCVLPFSWTCSPAE